MLRNTAIRGFNKPINPNDKIPMSNKNPNPNDKKYDLLGGTAKFGEDVIDLAGTLGKNEINRPLISQGIRSSTSIGANYMEANAAGSRKDFEYKITLCKKEAKETMRWSRMLARANPEKKDEIRKLWKEAQELVFIFSAILNSSRKKEKQRKVK